MRIPLIFGSIHLVISTAVFLKTLTVTDGTEKLGGKRFLVRNLRYAGGMKQANIKTKAKSQI